MTSAGRTTTRFRFADAVSAAATRAAREAYVIRRNRPNRAGIVAELTSNDRAAAVLSARYAAERVAAKFDFEGEFDQVTLTFTVHERVQVRNDKG